MGMETRLLLFHRYNRSLNISFLSSVSDFFSNVPAQIGQKRKMSYVSVFEGVHNIVNTFPYFSGTKKSLFCLKGFFLGRDGHGRGRQARNYSDLQPQL